VTLVEKVDFLLCCLPLYVPALCLAFMVVLGVGMALAFGHVGDLRFSLGGTTIGATYLRTFDDRFAGLWTPLFLSISFLLSLSPMLPTLALAVRGRIKRPFRLILISHVAYMSTMYVWLWELTDRICRIPTEFVPTMRRAQSVSPVGGRRTVRHGFSTAELVASGILAALLVFTMNLGLAAIAFCPIVGWISRERITYLALGAIGVVGGVAAHFVLNVVAVTSPFGFPQFVVSIHF
jgi:hypothetical protein